MIPTGTVTYKKVRGDGYQIHMTVAGPKSYVNGTGFQVGPNDFGLNKTDSIQFYGHNSLSNDYVYDPTTQFAKAIVRSTGVEVAGAVDLSADSLYFVALGQE